MSMIVILRLIVRFSMVHSFLSFPKECLENLLLLFVQCKPKHVEVRGQMNSSSNFRSHVKRRGSAVLEGYMQHIHKSKKNEEAKNISDASLHRRIGKCHQRKSQETFNAHIINYILHSRAPLRTVENPYFLKIFDYLKISGIFVQIYFQIGLVKLIDFKLTDSKWGTVACCIWAISCQKI